MFPDFTNADVSYLFDALKSDDLHVFMSAADELAKREELSAIPHFVDVLKSGMLKKRFWIVICLSNMHIPEAIPALAKAFEQSDESVIGNSIHHLSVMMRNMNIIC